MVRLWLSLAAAALSVAFALLPVEQQVAEYTWEPAEAGPTVPLILLEHTPAEFELELPCDLLDGDSTEVFRSTREPDRVGALVVRAGDGRITASVPPHPEEPDGPETIVGLEGDADLDCAFVVSYTRETGTLALEEVGRAGQRDEAIAPDAFDLTGLHWAAPADDVRGRVVTTAHVNVRNSVWQKSALALVALLGLSVLVLGWRSKRSSRREAGTATLRGPSLRAWRPHGSEVAVSVLCALLAFIDLPRVDDGRILARSRLLSNWDLTGNLVVLYENQVLPQRWLYEWFLGHAVSWSSTIPVLRLPAVIFVVAGWVLLRRLVIPALIPNGSSPAVFGVSGLVYAVFAMAWGTTLRPEPLLVLLVVGVLALVATWPDQPRSGHYGAIVGLAGLAVATHVAGLAAVFAAMPLLLRRLPTDLRHDPVQVLTGAAWGGAFSVVAMFLGSNLQRTFSAVTGFEETGDHDFGPLDTLAYLDNVDNSTVPMMLAAGLGIVAILVTLLSSARRLRGPAILPPDAIVLGAALSPFGLLFTPSKWHWHLLVLAPVAVVGWALLAKRVDRRWAPTSAFHLLVATVLGLMLAWALRPAWRGRMLASWADTGLRHVSSEIWSSRLPWLFGDGVRWWLWAVLLLGVAAVARWLLRRRASEARDAGVLAWLLVACLVVASTVQLAPPVADAVVAGDEWTFVRQSVVGTFSDQARCGVPSHTPSVGEFVDRQGGASSVSTSTRIAGHSTVFMYAPCHDPISQEFGVWQVPPLLMGSLPGRQSRILVEYDERRIGCNSFPQERSGEKLCFSVLESEGAPLPPTQVRWEISTRLE